MVHTSRADTPKENLRGATLFTQHTTIGIARSCFYMPNDL
jgi:hypothetical protein